jgi:hypothetical protein
VTSVRLTLSILLTIAISACSLLTVGQPAPDRCGFPEGTALSFGGRSTTSALGVQEVVGDPMSVEPADIYVTRDQFDQGDLHGRLVCAIYVNQPGFVEITVHPDDREPVVEGPDPIPVAPPEGISEEEAVATARGEVDEAQEWEFSAEAGPLSQLLPMEWETHEWSRDLPADLWVWRVFLVRGSQGSAVVIDFVDGTVYGVAEYIVN